jgi:hypothetical protein
MSKIDDENTEKNIQKENIQEDTTEFAIKSLKQFINNLDEICDDYNVKEDNVFDIYDILQSDIAESSIKNYNNIKELIQYQKVSSIKIINSITYEDICEFIKEYILGNNKLNLQSLGNNVCKNLIKINTNLVLQKIYKTAPRLIINSEEALFDILFEEETSKKKLKETINFIMSSEKIKKIDKK